MKSKIAVIGEFHDTFEVHTALNACLDYLKGQYGFDYEWVETDRVETQQDRFLERFSGIWSPPGSPFKSLEGALYAVTWARENRVPHLGTCAGLQHAVLEIARNLLGIADAQHEEYDPKAPNLFVNRLVCSLAGKTMSVRLKAGSLAHRLYDTGETRENYYCNFAVNPSFRHCLDHPGISVSGTDRDGELRIIELLDHPFFLATLFVPQTKFAPDNPHPVIKGFVEAVCGKARE